MYQINDGISLNMGMGAMGLFHCGVAEVELFLPFYHYPVGTTFQTPPKKGRIVYSHLKRWGREGSSFFSLSL